MPTLDVPVLFLLYQTVSLVQNYCALGATTNGESGDAKCNADANTDADDDQNSQEDGDGEEYVVEKVVKRRCMETGQYFCLVKWLGYPREYDTWEPEENLISVDKHDEFMASFTQRQYLVSVFKRFFFRVRKCFRLAILEALFIEKLKPSINSKGEQTSRPLTVRI